LAILLLPLLLLLLLLLSCVLARCGNIAAILELDEHLNKNFKVSRPACAVSYDCI
jgi:hypothetical protein